MSILGFEILSKIGQGAYSVVYKVRRICDRQIYALKKVSLSSLSQNELENTLNEIRIMASINHPNVISYKDSFILDQEKSLCLVMEYADSGDLSKKIQKCKRLSIKLEENFIWSVLIQVTQGLNSLHKLGIFHRDIKSSNVFLNKDGSVKLGDLNVSKVSSDEFLNTQVGTPYYASPEVWSNMKYSKKSDIWSLGCVVYEMMALKLPFRGNDMESIQEKVLNGEYEPIADEYSNEILQVLFMLLNKNQDLRPSCEEILKVEPVKNRIGIKKIEKCRSSLLERIRTTDEFGMFCIQLPKANYGDQENADGKRKRLLPRLRIQGKHGRAELHRTIEESVDRLKRIKDLYLSPNRHYLSPQIKLKKSNYN